MCKAHGLHEPWDRSCSCCMSYTVRLAARNYSVCCGFTSRLPTPGVLGCFCTAAVTGTGSKSSKCRSVIPCGQHRGHLFHSTLWGWLRPFRGQTLSLKFRESIHKSAYGPGRYSNLDCMSTCPQLSYGQAGPRGWRSGT